MHRKQEPTSITSASESLSVDQARRTKTYLIQMIIRVVCFLGAVATSGTLRWVLVALAVILPYIAVVKVNMGRANNQNLGNPMEYLQLETGPNQAQTPTDTQASKPDDDSLPSSSDSQEP